MSELARFEDVHYSERALELGPLTFERWAELGTLLGRIHGSVGFWVGDWLLHGEHAYGEKYAHALDVTGLDYSRLSTYAWVARQVDPSRRRENLSWSAHRAVASLEPAEADALLDRAERDGLGSQDLRRIVREQRALQAGEEAMVRLTIVAPRTAVDLWRGKARDRPLEDVAVELLTAWAADAA